MNRRITVIWNCNGMERNGIVLACYIQYSIDDNNSDKNMRILAYGSYLNNNLGYRKMKEHK